MATGTNDYEAAFDDEHDDEHDDEPGRHSALHIGTSYSPLLEQPEEHHEPAPALPGAYDFEPQISDRAPSTPRAGRTQGPSPARHRPLSLAERLLPPALLARLGLAPASTPEDDSLLTSLDDDAEPAHSQAYPPRGNSIAAHVPRPSRPPSFPAPRAPTGRVFGGGQGNDGVFANLSAKPDHVQRAGGPDYVGGEDGSDKDEVLPSYESAAVDSTPPYWETTVLTPQGVLGPDDICVDGLPVGNLFGFAWNLLVSMSFQFVGFLLTYLLHTTHAAKNGSRAGLGITLIQLGFYLKQRIDHPELADGAPGDATGLEGAAGPLAPPPAPTELSTWSWWGSAPPSPTSTHSALGSLPTQLSSMLSSTLDLSDPDLPAIPKALPSLGNLNGEDVVRMSNAANEWMAFLLVTVGAFLFIGGCLNYWRAVRWARAVQAGMGRGGDEEQRVVEA